MDKNEYLVAQVGNIKLGVYCRDVENVYCTDIKLVKLFGQGAIFRGLASLNGRLLQVIDLRKRIGMQERLSGKKVTLVSFNTGGSNSIAVIVDKIVGMQRLDSEHIKKNDKIYESREQNIGLLFPTVALTQASRNFDDFGIIHILDSTYLDKTQPIAEDSGELELF